MSFTKSNKIDSWSFSRYSTYKQCPRKAKGLFIDKIKEPPNKAMERGSMIHELAKNYVRGNLRALPPELKSFEAEMRALKKQHAANPGSVHTEADWAMKKDWSKTVYNDWAGCWLRVKLDVGHAGDTAKQYHIWDWKSGKCRPEEVETYTQQLELYALSALVLLPYVEEVYPQLGYLDYGIRYPEEPVKFTRADIEPLKKLWVKRTRPMLSDTTFVPRPNQYCGFCIFSHRNGGSCEFG